MKKRIISLALALVMVLALAAPTLAADDGWQEYTLTDVDEYLTVTLSAAKLEEKTIHIKASEYGFEEDVDETAKFFTLKQGSTVTVVVNDKVLDTMDNWYLDDRMEDAGVSTAQDMIGKATWANGIYLSEIAEDTYSCVDLYMFSGGTVDENWDYDLKYIPVVDNYENGGEILCVLLADRGTEGTGNTPTPAQSFTDVGSSYTDAVKWAVDNKFAEAKSATTFGAETPCPRGEVVEILWKALGSPEPTSTVNPFTDVKETDSFYKAVLWAAENGVTTGTSKTLFSPNATVKRCDAMTFIWRAANKPDSTAANPFGDVPAGQYYTTAVLWAVEHGITTGTTTTTFSPANPVTRAQMVTFLYRQLAGKA